MDGEIMFLGLLWTVIEQVSPSQSEVIYWIYYRALRDSIADKDLEQSPVGILQAALPVIFFKKLVISGKPWSNR